MGYRFIVFDNYLWRLNAFFAAAEVSLVSVRSRVFVRWQSMAWLARRPALNLLANPGTFVVGHSGRRYSGESRIGESTRKHAIID